jgi:hypothetical protein
VGLEARCVQQAESHVQILAEGPFLVVVHLPACRTARSRSMRGRPAGRGDAAVARGEQAGEDGDQAAEEQRLGEFVRGPQQDQEPVAAVGERIVVLAADPGHEESLRHEPVDLLAQFFLDRIGPPRAALDIEGQDAPVPRKRHLAAWPLAMPQQCVTVVSRRSGGRPT